MSLLDNMQNEPARTLAIREPVTVELNTSVHDAVIKMRDEKLGCAILVDEGKPTGMFTEAMLRELISEAPSAINDPIGKHTSSQCPRVKLSDPIADGLTALEVKNVRFLCVVDEEGRVAGLTGQKGLMEYVADHFPQQVMVQRIGGEPFPLEREGA